MKWNPFKVSRERAKSVTFAEHEARMQEVRQPPPPPPPDPSDYIGEMRHHMDDEAMHGAAIKEATKDDLQKAVDEEVSKINGT